MANIPKKPPSYIRIRTLESDTEQMRQSGGEINRGRVAGKKMEEIEMGPAVKEEAIFEDKDTPPEQAPGKKNKIVPIIIILLAVFLLGGAAVFFLLAPKQKNANPVASASPTPQYVSLLKNFNGPLTYAILTGNTDDFEKILNQEFKKLSVNQAEEIAFMKNQIGVYPANDFLRLLYANFPGIGLTNIPDFEADFSFLAFQNQNTQASLAYVLKINEANLSTFTLSNLKAQFATSFEKFIEDHSELLTPQYLENVGNPQKLFLTKTIGSINGRYLTFSTSKEFYYGFYQNYFIVATSQESFQKTLEFLLPKI